MSAVGQPPEPLPCLRAAHGGRHLRRPAAGPADADVHRHVGPGRCAGHTPAPCAPPASLPRFPAGGRGAEVFWSTMPRSGLKGARTCRPWPVSTSAEPSRLLVGGGELSKAGDRCQGFLVVIKFHNSRPTLIRSAALHRFSLGGGGHRWKGLFRAGDLVPRTASRSRWGRRSWPPTTTSTRRCRWCPTSRRPTTSSRS